MSAYRAGTMHYFAMLDEQEQADAVVRLAKGGMSDHGVASVTGLNVEAVRRILGQRAGCEGSA